MKMIDLSKVNFETDRLVAANWNSILADTSFTAKLKRELTGMLTPKITQYLPRSMQFSARSDSISDWISNLNADAEILCLHSRESGALVGLIILNLDTETAAFPTIHLGYFLAEKDWGKGYATEIIIGLMHVIERGPKVKILAGVDAENISSSKVLKKSGFRLIAEESTETRYFYENNAGGTA